GYKDARDEFNELKSAILQELSEEREASPPATNLHNRLRHWRSLYFGAIRKTSEATIMNQHNTEQLRLANKRLRGFGAAPFLPTYPGEFLSPETIKYGTGSPTSTEASDAVVKEDVD
ncbi:hypothetical protein HDU93_004052, partial [Gonapodya sp. JEL0774]